VVIDVVNRVGPDDTEIPDLPLRMLEKFHLEVVPDQGPCMQGNSHGGQANQDQEDSGDLAAGEETVWNPNGGGQGVSPGVLVREFLY
jgi:hypothetical protein